MAGAFLKARRCLSACCCIGTLLWFLSACAPRGDVLSDDLLAQKEVILEQIAFLNPESNPGYPPLFLAAGSENLLQEPEAKLLESVQHSYERIFSVSKGSLEPDRKVKDRSTGTEGVLVWFGPVTWEDRRTAVIVSGQRYGLYGGEESRFRVRRVDGQWKVLDKTVLWVR